MSLLRGIMMLLLFASVGFAEEPSRWVEATYQPTTESFANPERGLYVELADRRQRPLKAEKLRSLREQNITLVQRLYYLKGYRDRPLDATQLEFMAHDFETLRATGMKAILRFAYSSRIGEPDAPLPIVMQHIEQLTPLLRENADLILTLQAGFVGAWGEWHASTNGLDEPAAMRQIAFALLDALPAERTIQVRTPLQKQRLLGQANPLTTDSIVRETAAARIGHHNDCFLADESDTGTYRDRHLKADRAYVAADSRFVPVGGETCRDGPRSDPATAREELARMHWSFLNLAYHRGVITKWRESGFLDEVSDRLGYRLRLERARFASEITAGGRLKGQLVFSNDGWAAPINPRPILLSLDPKAGGKAIQLNVPADMRNCFPGTSHTVAIDAMIPAATPVGSYTISLALPDASPRLANDKRYSIRLANRGLWSEPEGSHALGLRIKVQARQSMRELGGRRSPLETETPPPN